MKITSLILPAAALGLGAILVLPAEQVGAYAVTGYNLGVSQRDVRVYNTFADSTANDNQTPHAMFPGFQGAEMAIWKACVEWGSRPHGDGTGDPTQLVLGSGGANFDITWQGLAVQVGDTNSNIHSPLGGSSGGVLAYCELPTSDGWRIRYYEGWTWDDGPGSVGSREDIQSIACHEYGHALGLAHSGNSNATMYYAYSGGTADRSIHSDDQAGVQYVYGAASSSKPRINSVVQAGSSLIITGANFSGTGNKVWFTQATAGGNGTPVEVDNVSSDGTTITVLIPVDAGPGDVLVRKNATGHASISNAMPIDITPVPPCADPVNFCTTSPNSVGAGATMTWAGTPSLSIQDFQLGALGCPPGQYGIFYYGGSQISLPFGEGVRCVGSGGFGTYRFGAFQTDIFGGAYLPIDFGAPPVSAGSGAWFEGDQWFFQFWYRDPTGGPSGFNLSDGLSVTFCL